MGNEYKKCDKKTSTRYTNSIAYWIATDMQPYNVVSKEGFKHMMAVLCPGYSVPSRQVFADTKIPAIYADVKNRIANELQTIQYVALTFDCWTSNTLHPYIAITAHGINDNWELKTFCLSCTSMDIEHTAYNVKEMVLSVLENWEIPLSKISGITTDNGTNMIKAVELLDLFHVSCFGHTLNNGVSAALKLKPVNYIINKVTKIRGKFHYSSNMRRLLKKAQENRQLPIKVMPGACETRWWSYLPALEFIKDYHVPLRDVLYESRSNSKALLLLPNNEELELLNLICKILKPLQQLGEHMSAEKVVTASGLWPVYFRLENNLLRLDSTSFTCDLSQVTQEPACSVDLFSTETDCDISTIDFGTKSSSFETVAEISDEETQNHLHSVSTILEHVSFHIKKEILIPLTKRYNYSSQKLKLQAMTMLDPRYKSRFIDSPQDVINHIKLEMDTIGHQECKKTEVVKKEGKL